MNNFKNNRRSVRLKDYDYSKTGAYFITICTQNKECLFGKIVDGEMFLNEMGCIVKNEWLKTKQLRKNIKGDVFVVMPNHFHVIVVIDNDTGTARRAPTFEQFGKPVSNSIPTIVRGFKSAVTKQINKLMQTSGKKLWQRNYYEHIIRNEDDYNQIYEYINNNILKWDLDSLHPNNYSGTTHHTQRKKNRLKRLKIL